MKPIGEQGRIGFSLPVTFLSGHIASEDDLLWRDMYRTAADCLTSLKDNGVSTVEIYELEEKTPLDYVEKSAETVLKSGLGLTIHGWLPVEMGGQLLSIIDRMESIYKGFGLRATVALVVHGHSQSTEKHVEKTAG